MKSLNVSRNKSVVRVSVEVELNNRKSTLHISDKKAEEKFTNLLETVKTFSKFKKLSLSYNELDYYDNMVDVYDTPYIHFEKGTGKRKPTIDHQEHGAIPKDWSENFDLFLEDPKTMKPIEIFLEYFNIKLTPKQEKEIRKAMKGEGYFNCEF